MIDPDVRPAVDGDESQLAWLESEARRSLVDQRGGDRWLATHPERGERWSATLHDDLTHVWVGSIDEVLVGYLVMQVDGTVATVGDVWVTPMARELGFGDALLAAAMARARGGGAELLEGFALPGDRETKNLYERAAIKARLITVSTLL